MNTRVLKNSLGVIVVCVFLLPYLFSKKDAGVIPPSTSELAVDSLQVSTAKGESLSTVQAYYDVTKVVDGDTLQVDMNGDAITLRLIGINTPETVDPRRPVECFGREASAKAKEILTGARVRVEMDPSQGNYDKYGRTLAYVFLDDGTNFNEYMIREGYAYEYTYHLPYKYQTQFKDAEHVARTEERGLWADGACESKNVSVKIPPAIYSVTTSGKNYVCDKNTYNCSDFSTQQDAQAVFDACGGSANDVHKLDSDKDGTVCESLP